MSRIIIFTDSPASARRALDPSVHSGQGHSLAVCRALSNWFTGHPDRTIKFVQVPSSLKWGLQYRAHLYARELRAGVGVNPHRSFDFVRQRVTKTALDRWGAIFTVSSTYRGKNFLPLKSLKDEPLIPSYANGGTWLPVAGKKTALTARMTRCILAHAPIGEYYTRFNIDEPTECRCGEYQTRDHLLTTCNSCVYPIAGRIRYIGNLLSYLDENPWAFSFADRRAAPQGADPEDSGVG